MLYYLTVPELPKVVRRQKRSSLHSFVHATQIDSHPLTHHSIPTTSLISYSQQQPSSFFLPLFCLRQFAVSTAIQSIEYRGSPLLRPLPLPLHSRIGANLLFCPSNTMATAYQQAMPLPPMAPETGSSLGHLAQGTSSHMPEQHYQHYGAHDVTRQNQQHKQHHAEHGSSKDPRLRIKTYKRVSKALPPDPMPHKQRAMKGVTTVSTAILPLYFLCWFPTLLCLVHVSC